MTMQSIPCKECGNALWEVWDNEAECTNCGFIRPFASRTKRCKSPKQIQKIETIKAYFLGKEKNLAQWSVKFQDETGYAYVSVDTLENPLVSEGGSFTIGPRGKVECFLVHNITDDEGKRFWKSHWERRFKW